METPPVKIGLEVHGYIDVSKKLFCNCDVDHEAQSNTTVCPRCTGQPGNKPMATNAHAMRKALSIALMLNFKVNTRLLFQRKHYSWPDMPTGFQRTMSGSYSVPVGEEGNFRGIRIDECHLEEDPARWDPETGKVDYNRSGYPLIEIVTKPDFTSAEQVRDWLKHLVTALGYIQAIHKQAGIKSDVNVSIGPKFERVEIKNVNSLSSIVSAVEYEIERQKQEVSAGNRIPQQTRTWSDENGETIFMRSKETAQDYMFIPEPDLPAIVIDQEQLQQIAESLPESPEVKHQKLVAIGIAQEDATVLSNEFALIDLFERVAQYVSAALAARWIRREVVRVANYHRLDLDNIPLDAMQFAHLLKMVEDKIITENVAQKILEKMFEENIDVRSYVEQEGLAATGDSEELEKVCDEVILEQQKAVEDYRSGNEKSLHFLIGQVMRKTRGTAQPEAVREVFLKILG
ncbi:MAG: Asp-tRNA(Asn)/Glu-tRNA(Gln) amidotransferase subunit GatB [Nanoarchaeota archaeon]